MRLLSVRDLVVGVVTSVADTELRLADAILLAWAADGGGSGCTTMRWVLAEILESMGQA